jgi:putative transposase
MVRPLRIEFPGAVYHVTSRSDLHAPIFVDDEDRLGLLGVVAQALSRFDAQMLAYCLMGDHYHFVLHTRQANLSVLMRHINGIYTQAYNRRHNKAGPVFQGRFKAILVDRDAYLLDVCRYVELNPVRAGNKRKPHTWAWSSYRAHAGLEVPPEWLDSDGLHSYLLGRLVRSSADRRRAADRYKKVVAAAPKGRLWDGALRQQIYLGDENFVKRMRALADPHNSTDQDIPKVHQRKARSLKQWLDSCENRDEAMYQAHTQGALSMTAIGRETGLSVSRVSRLIAQAERKKEAGNA